MILKLLLNTQMVWLIFTKKNEGYNSNMNRQILIIFDDMMLISLVKKSLNPIVTESYIKDRKSNIFLVLITQPYFAVPKNIRLRSTHYFFMKILKKQQP